MTIKRKKPTTLDMMRGATKRPRMTVPQVLKAIGITWSEEEAKSILESVFGEKVREHEEKDHRAERESAVAAFFESANEMESFDEVEKLFDKDIASEKRTINKLKKQAKASGLYLEEKEDLLSKATEAESKLRRMLLSQHEAKDAAFQAFERGDIEKFSSYSALYQKVAALLKKLVAKKSTSKQQKPSIAQEDKISTPSIFEDAFEDDLRRVRNIIYRLDLEIDDEDTIFDNAKMEAEYDKQVGRLGRMREEINQARTALLAALEKRDISLFSPFASDFQDANKLIGFFLDKKPLQSILKGKKEPDEAQVVERAKNIKDLHPYEIPRFADESLADYQERWRKYHSIYIDYNLSVAYVPHHAMLSILKFHHNKKMQGFSTHRPSIFAEMQTEKSKTREKEAKQMFSHLQSTAQRFEDQKASKKYQATVRDYDLRKALRRMLYLPIQYGGAKTDDDPFSFLSREFEMPYDRGGVERYSVLLSIGKDILSLNHLRGNRMWFDNKSPAIGISQINLGRSIDDLFPQRINDIPKMRPYMSEDIVHIACDIRLLLSVLTGDNEEVRISIQADDESPYHFSLSHSKIVLERPHERHLIAPTRYNDNERLMAHLHHINDVKVVSKNKPSEINVTHEYILKKRMAMLDCIHEKELIHRDKRPNK